MQNLLLVRIHTNGPMKPYYLLTKVIHKGIGGRVPRSLMSYSIDVLYKLTGRYIEVSRHWLASLLHQVFILIAYGSHNLKNFFTVAK